MHECFDFVGMPSTDDDVVVTDGMLQQIRLQVDVKGDLRAAEVVAVRRCYGLCLGDDITVELRTAPFL